MEIYEKFILLPYCLFSLFSNMISSDTLILPVSQLQTQQVKNVTI